MAVTENFDSSTDAPLARYFVGEAESVSEAIVAAFEQTGARGLADESVLYDWIEPDALDLLFRHSQDDLRVVLELWGHPVRVSRETVTIYDSN